VHDEERIDIYVCNITVLCTSDSGYRTDFYKYFTALQHSKFPKVRSTAIIVA